VETTRDFVPLATEFSSGVERAENSFKCRDLRLLVRVDWNTTAVVDDANIISGKKYDFDTIRKTAHRFITRVVENFPDEMVKSIRTRGTNVHAGTLAYWLKSLEDLDGICAV
jgi:hypothetical protein